MDENGEIAASALAGAKSQIDASNAYWQSQSVTQSAGISSIQWVSNGPQNVGGRTLSLVINPQNTEMMWAAAASGGIWFTSNGGTTWIPVNDFLSTLNANSLAMHPSNPQVIYCGTGESNFKIGTDNSTLPGAGIFKTTNATSGSNASWTQIPSTSSWEIVNSISISPNGNTILAAMATSTFIGVQRSTDGGTTWGSAYASVYHVIFHPTDNNKAVAGVINGSSGTVVYSTNGGISWNPSDLSMNSSDGVKLSYAIDNPTKVYVSAADLQGHHKIWRSTNGGQNFSLMTDSSQVLQTQGVYTNALWVCPSDSSFIIFGGVALHKSMNSGLTFTTISGNNYLNDFPHLDQHFIVSDPGFNGTTNKRVYVCTDGGIYRADDIFTANLNSGWVGLNSTYQTTQFYGAAGNSSYIIGGTQDNGTLRVSLGNPIATLMAQGDGGFCAIDSNNSNYSYGEYFNLNITRSTDGGFSVDQSNTISGYMFGNGSWRNPPYVISDAMSGQTNFIAPFVLDPNNPNRMYAGGHSLWKSDNVTAAYGVITWSNIRPGLGNEGNLSSIAVAPSDSNVVWISDNKPTGGNVNRSTDGGITWRVIDNNNAYTPQRNPLPNRAITRIYIDPSDANKVYVATGGFTADNLWRTTNGLANTPIWTDISGTGTPGIPPAPIRAIARHPSQPDWLYAGTEVGVFSSENGGTNWVATGPNNAAVFDLFFIKNTTTLVAATFGRGLWTINASTGTFYKLSGTVFGTPGAYLPGREMDKAYDGDTQTYFDADPAHPHDAYTGIDLGSGNARKIVKIRYFPRSDWPGGPGRMEGGRFQGSNSQTSGYVDLHTITVAPIINNWVEVTITDLTTYRYLRYLSPTGGYCNAAEVEFYGN